jgi:hypothetical protein
MIESYSYRRNDDYYRDVARGGVAGARPFGGFGKRTTAGAESNIIWPNGTFTVPPVTGTTVSFKSDDAADTAGGTGIRTLGVVWVDTSYQQHLAVITMNGTSDSVDTLTGAVFIQCMFMITYGSGKAATGNISAYNATETYSYITAGDKRCSSSLRMVPAGKRLLVAAAVAGSISGTAAVQSEIRIVASTFHINAGGVAYDYDYSADSVFMPQAELVFQDGSFGLPFPIPIPFNTGEIVGMEFTVDGKATIVGTWFGVLEEQP